MSRIVFLFVATCLLACGPPAQQAPVKQPALEPYHGCGIPSTAENPEPCGRTSGGTHARVQPEPPPEPALEKNEPKPSAWEIKAEVVRIDGLFKKLAVKEPVSDGYNRKDWRHWVDEDKDCQDTRQEVLIEESEVPVTFKPRPDNKKCKVLTGRWTCPYTGEIFTQPSKLDVAHMVPLGAAHAAGGYTWNAEQKRAFANSLEAPHHLIAVKASANRSKGKRGPEEWMPEKSDFHCEYVLAWIEIKVRWGLSASEDEYDEVGELIDVCALDLINSECADSVDPLCGL